MVSRESAAWNDWKNAEDTPAWAAEFFERIADDEITTVQVAHLQAEVELCQRILTEQPPDVWQMWAKDQDTPLWMRSCIVEYSVLDSRWGQARHIADLELVEEIVSTVIESDEQDQ